MARGIVLGVAQSPHDLLDVDRGRGGCVAPTMQSLDPLDGWPSPQVVDQDGGVQNMEQESPSASRVAVTLLADPGCRVGVPLVGLAGECACRRPQRSPPLFLAYRVLDCRPHKGAAPARAGQLVHLSDKRIVQLYVHSHVCNVAHST